MFICIFTRQIKWMDGWISKFSAQGNNSLYNVRSFPFRSLSIPALSILLLHFPLQNPARGSGERCKLPRGPRPQTDFDASTGIKTHLMAASFSFPPTFPMTQNASFPLGLDTPVINWSRHWMLFDWWLGPPTVCSQQSPILLHWHTSQGGGWEGAANPLTRAKLLLFRAKAKFLVQKP